MSQIYACLGYNPQCGRCARILKRIMDEMRNKTAMVYRRPAEILADAV